MDRRAALIGIAGLAGTAVLGQPAEAKPHRKPRRFAATFSDDALGGDVARTFNVVVGPPGGTGFPNASNTGWQPTGVTLTTYTEGTLYIDTPGAVIDSLDIPNDVYVRAANVTIKRCKITSPNQPMVKTWEPDGLGGLIDLAPGLVIEDTEFDGTGDDGSTTVSINSYTLRRCNIHSVGSGARCGNNVTVQDCYLHDFASTVDSHNGGLPCDSGSGQIIRHNAIHFDSTNGYGIAAYNDQPPGNVVSNVTIDRNLIAGGNYCLTGGATLAPNLRITNNAFSREFFANGGFFGPASNCAGCQEWTNNYWLDTGLPVSP